MVRPTAAAQTGAHLAFAGGVIATSLLAASAVYLPSRIYQDRAGRPDVLVPAIALIPATAIKIALSYFLLPELYRAGGGEPDIANTRATMWKWVQWPALGAAVSVALYFFGAALEHEQFGRGQYVMIAGFSGLALSHTLFDVLAIVGSSKGYRQ